MAKYYDKKTKQWVEGNSTFPLFGFTSPEFLKKQKEYSDTGIAQNFEIVSPDDLMYMEGGGVADLVDKKKDKKNKESAMKGAQDRGMVFPTSVAKEDSLKDLEIKMKKKPKVPEPKEEAETETGKDYGELGFFQKLLKAATENPEATLALGRALLKGEGLGIGLADFAEEKIAQDKAEAALEKEAEETLYERKLKEREFQLDVAKAEDLANYYAQMGYAAVAKTDRPLKEIEYGVNYAQLSRDSEGNPLKPGTAEFDAKVIEGMENYSKDKKPDLASLLGVSTGDEDSQQVGTATVGTNTINVPYLDLGK